MILGFCGDGGIQGAEQCDNGESNSNLVPGACRTNCRRAFCGDGVLDPGEACDDGNADDSDGCTWKCAVSVCGNGIIEPPEECDAGAENSDKNPNACRSVCRKAFCGDGVKDATEECDDGNDLSGDGCSPACTVSCPAGASKIQEKCIVLHAAEAECGVGCTVGRAWESFVDFVFGFFS